MQTGKIAAAGLTAGIVANVIDFLSFTFLFKSMMTLPFMNPNPLIAVLVAGDFVAALVFVWVYDRVRGSFGPGAKGGATYGLYAGILINFPLWIFMHVLVKDWPSSYSWFSTIYGIVWAIILGAVVGVVYDKVQARVTVPA
jgi:hypothetical protein